MWFILLLVSFYYNNSHPFSPIMYSFSWCVEMLTKWTYFRNCQHCGFVYRSSTDFGSVCDIQHIRLKTWHTKKNYINNYIDRKNEKEHRPVSIWDLYGIKQKRYTLLRYVWMHFVILITHTYSPVYFGFNDNSYRIRNIVNIYIYMPVSKRSTFHCVSIRSTI